MSSIKGARNGFYYGSRLRLAHALVMSLVFGSGPLMDRGKWAFKMAFNHGKLLSIFVFSYKTAQCILTKFWGKQVPFLSFIAGIIGSQMIIKPHKREFTTVNRQLAYYLFSRVVEGVYVKLQKLKIIPTFQAFNVVYIFVWASVMYLFEKDKSVLNKSMMVSMEFIYKDSDKDLESWTDLIPIEMPAFLSK